MRRSFRARSRRPRNHRRFPTRRRACVRRSRAERAVFSHGRAACRCALAAGTRRARVDKIVGPQRLGDRPKDWWPRILCAIAAAGPSEIGVYRKTAGDWIAADLTPRASIPSARANLVTTRRTSRLTSSAIEVQAPDWSCANGTSTKVPHRGPNMPEASRHAPARTGHLVCDRLDDAHDSWRP